MPQVIKAKKRKQVIAFENDSKYVASIKNKNDKTEGWFGGIIVGLASMT